MTEPGNADHDDFKVFGLRLNRLARPEVVLPRVMRTNLWDLNMASELSCFFEALFDATEYGYCKITLGHSNGVIYSFAPISAILQLEEKVHDQQKLAELASPVYFYVQKRDIGQVSHLPWGGSSASLLPGCAQNAERTRKLSIRSSGSEDSGYASGDAHSVSENLAAISEDVPEQQARLGSSNERPTSDLVISFSFFTFGRLYSKPTSSESRATITDYTVAVSLCDFSLWAIFDAWDEDWIEAEEGDEVDRIGVDRYETPVKPLRSSTWGTLPGTDGRVLMAKLANNVYSHVYAPTAQIIWNIAPEEWSPNEIPVLFPALKTLNGPVTSPILASLSLRIPRNQH